MNLQIGGGGGGGFSWLTLHNQACYYDAALWQGVSYGGKSNLIWW